MRTILLSVLVLVAAICSAQDGTYATISTKGGQQIKVILFKELPAATLKQIDEHFCAMFPAATMLKVSSMTYNCHSYAWNMTDGGSACWINDEESKRPNLSKYWTDDYYSEVQENDVLKIHYYNADHSAVSSGISGMYESKWGKGPLMRHAPGYGPYEKMDKRRYYNHVVPVPVYGPLVCSIGQGEIAPNTAASYYPSSSQIARSKILRVEYTIYTQKGNDAVAEGSAVVNSVSGDVLNVTFTAYGIYEMSVHCYNKFNEFMGTFSYEPLVTL